MFVMFRSAEEFLLRIAGIWLMFLGMFDVYLVPSNFRYVLSDFY